MNSMDLKKRKLDVEENGGAPQAPLSSSLISPSQAAPIAPSLAPPSSAAVDPALQEDVAAAAGPRSNGAGVPAYLTPNDARRMIEPLSKEQLLEILIEATLRHYDILEEVRKHADKDLTSRKIFVRGLGWDTTTETLKSVFAQYGELEEAIVIVDKITGKNRGYGFVTFKHMDGAINALKEPSKRIDGRIAVCQLASLGPSSSQNPQDIASRKIYVGNVPLEWPVDHLLNIFDQYGEIEEGPLGLDKQSGRSRGFALFIYKTAEAAKLALEEPVKMIDGHQLFCKLAVEGLKQRMAGAPQGQQPDMQGVPTGATGQAPASMQYGGMQYGAAPQGVMGMGAPYGQNASPSVNTGLSPVANNAMNPNIAGPSYMQPVSNPSNLNPSVPSGFGASHGPAMSSGPLTLPSYGTHGGSGSYGQQMAPYGGQPGGYSGLGTPAGMYNLGPGPAATQSSVPQGQAQYSLSSYQSQQQPLQSYQTQQQMLPSYQNPQQGTVSSTQHSSGAVPSMPYYGM